MAMKQNKLKKHNVDFLFLMILFLVFTFSAVSVLLMAVSSYKSVVYANEENANVRTATAYIREQVRTNDDAGKVLIANMDGNEALRIDKVDGIVLYIYCYDGYLMELETKRGADVTAEFGNKLVEAKDLDISWVNTQLLEVTVKEADGSKHTVEIGVKSKHN